MSFQLYDKVIICLNIQSFMNITIFAICNISQHSKPHIPSPE